ncbi:hypothetical protein [Actinomadura sp. WAC 06369]|uniref:hypothetical protein n=1 Tax=Actinomadura sp. WAC 06369 TaxID=2203193 RepID=UPI000F795C07|nr:hypothetical protein [Actinomadura sp. WAC 06369]
MRRVMSYVAPWAGVTALAVTLSWLGVRDVVRATVSERAAPPPIAGPVIRGSPTAPTAGPTARPDGGGRDRAPGPAAPRPPGNVRSYAVKGGQAAMSLRGGEVRLVSATPNPGFETRVTGARGWLRVDFRAARRTSSIIASWNGRDPVIRVYEY